MTSARPSLAFPYAPSPTSDERENLSSSVDYRPPPCVIQVPLSGRCGSRLCVSMIDCVVGWMLVNSENVEIFNKIKERCVWKATNFLGVITLVFQAALSSLLQEEAESYQVDFWHLGERHLAWEAIFPVHRGSICCCHNPGINHLWYSLPEYSPGAAA